jgi:hypothetical protein
VLVAHLQDDVAAGDVGGVEPPVVGPREFGAKDVVVIVGAASEDGPAAGKFVALKVA